MPEDSLLTETLPVGVASGLGLLLSLYFLILCVCGKSKEKKEGNSEETTHLRNGTESQVNSVAVTIDESGTVLRNPEANGNVRNSGGSPKGSSSPHPPGTNHRELPQPPTTNRNTIGGKTNPFRGETGNKRNTIGGLDLKEDQDDYDHLSRQGFQKGNTRRSNYDHIQLGEDGQFHVQARKPDPPPEELPENDYAEVERENIYEGVKDKQEEEEEAAKRNVLVSNPVKRLYDPYSSVNDDEEEEEVNIVVQKDKKVYDPYAKVKERSNSVKKNSDDEKNASDSSHVKTKDYDPYSKVKDGDSNSGSFSSKPFDPYSRVKEDKDDSSGGTFKDIDPYSTVKEERTPRGKGKDDPYSKVKDAIDPTVGDEYDDPYNKLVDDPYNKVKDEDPYNKVKTADSFNKGKGDDPYNKVKDEDPYNSVKGDDPYNKVTDEEPEDPYNSVEEEEGLEEGEGHDKGDPASYEYSTVNKVNQELRAGGFSVVGEYAQVMKNKDPEANANRPLPLPDAKQHNRRSAQLDSHQLPPEPPRRYQDDYSEGAQASSTSQSTNGPSPGMGATGGAEAAPVVVPSAPTNNTGSSVTETTKRKEPPYHMLTARESMASINARRALNTYEEVSDRENMYATVEGGSGDGIVTSKGGAQNSQRPVRQELYEEIPNGDQLPAPAPPSLDILHLMTEGKSRDPDSSNRSSYAESQKSPGATASPRCSSGSTEAVSIGLVNPAFTDDPEPGAVSLDPNYTTVRDCIPERQGEGDPNYESVEEVKSKVQEVEQEEQRKAMRERKKRLHVYEEVKEGETNPVRERVLRGHMYQDLDGVKTQKEELDKEEVDPREAEVWKRRSDVFSERL